jgi:uncharacterized Tic20 family protein
MEPREQNVRTWSMLVHLAALAVFLFPPGLVLGPLIVWQIKKNELPEIDPHGKQAVNFQLTVIIINIILVFLIFGSMGASFFWHSPFYLLGPGFGLAAILWLFNLVAIILAVVAGLKANNGERFRYPFAIPFIK